MGDAWLPHGCVVTVKALRTEGLGVRALVRKAESEEEQKRTTARTAAVCRWRLDDE